MRKLWIFMIFAMLLSACSGGPKTPTNNDPKEPSSDTLLSKFTIDLNVTNADATSEEYLVFFLMPDAKEKEPGKATQSGYYGPLTTTNHQIEIDLEYNFNLNWYIEEAAALGKGLDLYVTTFEDIYLRNPLNKPITLNFFENKDEDTEYLFPYGVKQENYKVDVVDKYPDGVLSLTFPDATFVIKLEFEGETDKSSYEVTIHRPDPNMADGISIYRIGRINRAFQYWDTPFFEADNMKTWSGYIVINDFETNARVNYEGYPRFIEFDEDGRCKDGDIVRVLITP